MTRSVGYHTYMNKCISGIMTKFLITNAVNNRKQIIFIKLIIVNRLFLQS
jgi:hypothetical protein